MNNNAGKMTASNSWFSIAGSPPIISPSCIIKHFHGKKSPEIEGQAAAMVILLMAYVCAFVRAIVHAHYDETYLVLCRLQ